MRRKVFSAIIGCILVISIAGCVDTKLVKLEIPDGKIKSIYLKAPSGNQRPSLLILPGFSGLRTSRKEEHYSFARWLNKEYDFNVLLINYRARSDSEMWKIINMDGRKAFRGEVKAALDYLHKQDNVDRDKIGLIGFSYGTILAVRTAGIEKSVKALVLCSPAMAPMTPVGNLWSAYDFSLSADRPMLFIASEKDDIPQNNSNAAENALFWSQKVNSPKKVKITKGGHHSTELLQVKGIKEMIGDWLQRYLI